MSIKFTENYSPNFDSKKRKPNQVKFIIFHYTGMKNDKQALERLTDIKSFQLRSRGDMNSNSLYRDIH